MASAVQVRSHQGDTVDTICWRHLGSSADVEATLQLNPGLAALGPELPIGTLVTLPAATQAAAAQNNHIQLWD